MVINGMKTLIMKCDFCGKLMEYDFNVFEVMTKGKKDYQCACGQIIAQFKNGKKQNINLNINCFKCGNKHNYILNLKDMLKDDNIYCPYGKHVLFLGDGNGRNKLLMEKQINMGKNNPEDISEIYIKVLKQLAILNENHRLDCDCGNSKLEIDFFYDSVEIKCLNCHSVSIIFAETEEDLSVLLKKDKIILKEHNISCIDSISEMKRNMKK